MILLNLQLTIKNLKKYKLFTSVNLAGLIIGIVAACLILIYITYELSFDRHNKNAKNIYRVYSTFTHDGVDGNWMTTPTPLASFLQDKLPEINNTVRIARVGKGLLSSGAENFFEENIIIADPSIFDVFTIPLISGDQRNALSQPNSIVISESVAKKYFGNQDPVGETVRHNRTLDLTITGIMKDIPLNSHLQFNMIIGMSSANALFWDDFLENKLNTTVATYLLTVPGIDFERLNKSINLLTDEYQPPFAGETQLFHIQSLTSIHLHSSLGGEFMANGNIKNIYILATIAFLILVVASINYINLSLSLNNNRNHELRMRRIMGAHREQLIFLYLMDAAVFVGIAIAVSIMIIYSQLPWFNSFLNADLINNISPVKIFAEIASIFILLTLIIGIASGWKSSRINLAERVTKPVLSARRKFSAQGILTLFQFTISIALIMTTLIIYKQIDFIQNLNLGFSKERLMIIPLNDNSIRSNLTLLKQEIVSQSNVVSAGLTSGLPGEMRFYTSINYEGRNENSPSRMAFLSMDEDFFNVYDVKFKEGYLPNDPECPYSGVKYWLNESAVKKLGWDAPIGKTFFCPNGDGFIAGIVSDFHFKSLHTEIEPLFMFIKNDNTPFYSYQYLTVKLGSGNISNSIEYIQNVWYKMIPDGVFEYYFYDDHYNQLYKSEIFFGKIIFMFSLIAILIACMGLFCLSVYFSENRTKEIGIRKVCGASISDIIILLNKDFAKWVLIAFVFAVPLSWYATNKWMQGFAYRTELNWLLFALTGICVLGITLLTVSLQSWRAASANPVEAIKAE
jgi:putative ABC transport system permease protein